MKKTEAVPHAPKLIVYGILASLLFGISSLIINLADFNSDKIVYVDAIKLLNGYTGMAEARKEYEQKVSVWNANLDTLKMEFESKVLEYQTKRSKLSPKESELLEELIETREQQFLDYQKLVSEKNQKEDQELTTKVYSRINEYIKKYAENKGYRFVLSANQYGSIVYAQQGVDITDEILNSLNAEYTK